MQIHGQARGIGEAAGKPLAYTVLCGGVLAIVLAHWPGRLNVDSLATIGAVRDWSGQRPPSAMTAQDMLDRPWAVTGGAITDQWSPVLTWLWRQAYVLVGLGPGVVLALQTIALAGGLYMVLRGAFRPIGAALLATSMLFAPSTFGLVGLVGRDGWFVSCCVLAAGFAVAGARWTGAARWTAIAGGVVAASVAMAARQNGFTAVMAIMVGLAVLAAATIDDRRGCRRPRRRTWPAASLVGVATTAAIAGATVVGGTIAREHVAHPEIYTYLYDLGYLTLSESEQLIPTLPQATQPVQTPSEVAERWLPEHSIAMRWHPGGDRAANAKVRLFYDGHEAERLGTAWRKAVTDHPGDYLRGRFGMWRRGIGIAHTPGYAIATDSPPNPSGYQTPAFPELSDLAARYASHWGDGSTSFSGGTVHHVWPYLLACVLGLALLLPRFAAPVRMVGALAAAGIGLQVGLFFLAPSAELRFQLLTIYAGLAVLLIATRLGIATLLSRTRDRSLER